MAKRSTIVGLDVHKESIDVVTAQDGAEGEVRHFGTIGGDFSAVDRVVKQLARQEGSCVSSTKQDRAGSICTAISGRKVWIASSCRRR